MSPHSKSSLSPTVKKSALVVLGLSAWLSFICPLAAESQDEPAEEPASEQRAERPSSSYSARKITGDELVRLAWTDLSGFRGALANGANPNARTRIGDYPIIRLAYGGNVEAVEILLDFNARTDVINVPDNATSKDALSALTSFVAEREKMDLRNFSVMTAIVNASPQVTHVQKIKMAQLVLAYGYDVDFYDGWGQTALMGCVTKNNISLAKLLIAYGADSEAHNLLNGKTSRDYAENEEMFRVLRGRKIYAPNKKPSYGQAQVRLVRPRMFPEISRITTLKKALDSTKESPLHLAVKDGDVRAVRELIDNGAQVITYDLNKKTPLHVLCENQDIPLGAFREIYRMMKIDSGSKILSVRDDEGRVPFHLLCQTGRDDLVEFLAKENLKQIQATDSNQNTPLHYAVLAGKDGRDLIRFLMANDAEVDHKNRDDETPLSIAVRNADAEAFYLLFDGVKIDPVTGISSFIGDPLFVLAFRSISSGRDAGRNANLIEILRVLIENGVDVDQLHEGTGRNALHYAILAGNVPAVELLLGTDININKADLANKTPMDLARDTRNTEISNMLSERGARIGKSGFEERRTERENRSKMSAQERRAERLKKKAEGK